MLSIAIILPVLNESSRIRSQLETLQSMRKAGASLIVVDGGSGDNTRELARPLVDQLIDSPRGRAIQMNKGAQASVGDVLLFLHADTTLPPSAYVLICEAIGKGALWGRFDVRIDGAHLLLRVVERMMNWRSSLTGIVTGDQAIFVRRDLFEQTGGYPELPLMEDIALSAKLKRIARPVRLRSAVVTSARRWEEHGIVRTILLMWRLRAEFFFGVDPVKLAVRYGYTSGKV